MPRDMEARVERIEGDLYRIEPDNPGAILRLDRIERLLSAMLKVGYFLGGLGLLWKALEVVGDIFHQVARP